MIQGQVDVYYNVTKNCLSVRQRGKVIAHVESIILRNATFRVSEVGRQKVLRQKRKNVHAVIRGEVISLEPVKELLGTRIRYNPYHTATFVKEDGTPISEAFEVAIHGRLMQAVEEAPFGWPEAT